MRCVAIGQPSPAAGAAAGAPTPVTRGAATTIAREMIGRATRGTVRHAYDVSGWTTETIRADRAGADTLPVLAHQVAGRKQWIPRTDISARAAIVAIRPDVDALFLARDRAEREWIVTRSTNGIRAIESRPTDCAAISAIVAVADDVQASTVATAREVATSSGALLVLLLVVLFLVVPFFLVPGVCPRVLPYHEATDGQRTERAREVSPR